MDTAMVLQMKLGLNHVQSSITAVLALIDGYIAACQDMTIMSRTNGQHAVPIYLASKFKVWRSELELRVPALDATAGRGFNVQISGPVGDLRGYENGTGQQVKQGGATSLGSNVVEPHW
ncbi:hypothetical protein RA27_00290 [Ruegeria sp. ANG-R]|uniref:lyase family protein n=1 Tax=Ruegeria sp. ANG-R TaxID=1577903 RepID=UPI00057C5493|nr:lyase family protein [Ruegeria sp. ANG-R]KIC41896.1 hypothetical protein RA27_00290 [Ruegeria sp. ANG-R]